MRSGCSPNLKQESLDVPEEMRRIYLTEATLAKVKEMALEKAKLYIQNAKTISKSYKYLWSLVEDREKIDTIEYEVSD